MLNLSDDLAIDMTTVSDEIQKMGKDIKRITPILVECCGLEFTSSFTDKYAEIILDCAKRRQIIDLANEMIVKATDRSEVVNVPGYQQELSKIHFGKVDDGVMDAKEATMAFNEWMDNECLKEYSGVMTGYEDVDRVAQGFKEGYLVVLAARPSMGKTAFAIDMLKNIAKCGQGVILYSLEMSLSQVMARMIAGETEIDSVKLLQPKSLNTEEWDKVVLSYNEVSKLPFCITDKCNAVVEDICVSIRRAKVKWDIDMAIIDHLQLMRSSQKSENRTQEIGYITRVLKGIAVELKISVVVLSQLSRGVESRNDKRPMMSDLRDSGETEQNADVVVTLYRDLYYNENGDEWTEVSVKKNRNGTVGTARVMFEPQYCRFKPMENDFGGQIVGDVPI